MTKAATGSWRILNGKKASFAESAEMIIIVKVKLLIHDAAQDAKLKNQLLPEPYFIIASSLFTKLFT
jgi:hypothetical protein